MNENYDNPKLMVTGRKRDRFDLALQLSEKDTAVGWSEAMINPDEYYDEGTKIKTLVFYWAEPTNDPNFHKFPTPLDHTGMADLAWRWLENLSKEDYDATEYDDGDVENRRGWLVFTHMWGHVLGWQSFVGVQPYSCWLGK